MARKKYEQICVRFSLEDEKDRQLYKILDDLNHDIHKSRNRFIKNAIEAYVNGYGVERIVKNPEKKEFLTQNDLDNRIEQIKNQLRTELYQELLEILLKSGVANIITSVNNKSNVALQNDNVSNEFNESTNTVSASDEMMEDIMKWS